ncbi:hypothetical protein TSTA_098200 [Talaromyces stipitatus ATCC 10500]|uniref:Uncharacterized protein n=1 Tax=Talaromyces stipitatus (strain ATCC 10500 / CBS 375.48 / QM 6759 / NRRL 1006) TaxID=441959 RepID=B8MM51_TALSN|nr:uncharacterized protein TSTA_098200 [Talaromyces stipitatus ATCC 10500]EED13563.1 hypothetical protein TSTA_098200 [Talaromyces stipitatus ATCC 10500]
MITQMILKGRNPLHSNLDYVYIVDRDAGALIIPLWKVENKSLRPAAIRIDLSKFYETSGLIIMTSLEQSSYVSDDQTSRKSMTPSESLVYGTLTLNFGPPTPMNELQEQFFTDFVFICWRHPHFQIFDTVGQQFSTLMLPDFRALTRILTRLLEEALDSYRTVATVFAARFSSEIPKRNKLYRFYSIFSGFLHSSAVLLHLYTLFRRHHCAKLWIFYIMLREAWRFKLGRSVLFQLLHLAAFGIYWSY